MNGRGLAEQYAMDAAQLVKQQAQVAACLAKEHTDALAQRAIKRKAAFEASACARWKKPRC